MGNVCGLPCGAVQHRPRPKKDEGPIKFLYATPRGDHEHDVDEHHDPTCVICCEPFKRGDEAVKVQCFAACGDQVLHRVCWEECKVRGTSLVSGGGKCIYCNAMVFEANLRPLGARPLLLSARGKGLLNSGDEFDGGASNRGAMDVGNGVRPRAARAGAAVHL